MPASLRAGEQFCGPFQPAADPYSAAPHPRESPLSPALSVGTPMTIPAPSQHRARGGGGEPGPGARDVPGALGPAAPSSHGGHWIPAGAAAAAMVASSPQAHMQAHAAALAAVHHMSMSLQRQHQTAAASSAAAASMSDYDPPSHYDPAHSLQAILPSSMAAAMAASTPA